MSGHLRLSSVVLDWLVLCVSSQLSSVIILSFICWCFIVNVATVVLVTTSAPTLAHNIPTHVTKLVLLEFIINVGWLVCNDNVTA